MPLSITNARNGDNETTRPSRRHWLAGVGGRGRLLWSVVLGPVPSAAGRRCKTTRTCINLVGRSSPRPVHSYALPALCFGSDSEVDSCLIVHPVIPLRLTRAGTWHEESRVVVHDQHGELRMRGLPQNDGVQGERIACRRGAIMESDAGRESMTGRIFRYRLLSGNVPGFSRRVRRLDHGPESHSSG